VSDEQEAQVGPVMMFTAKRGDVAEFYKSVLGLSGEDSGDSIWLDAANAKVVVHEATDPQTPPEVRSQASFVVWFGVADVRGAYERAKRAGSAIGDFHGDFFYAKDPDGRYVGIYTLEDPHGHDHGH
jgi:catechol-2,3-dioxygenase